MLARPCAMRSLDLPFRHRVERMLERKGILVARLDCLLSQVGGAGGMLVQVVERRYSVGPIERLPIPPGLHAAADNAQQLLPLLVQLEGLFVQLRPPPLQRMALRYRRLPPVIRLYVRLDRRLWQRRTSARILPRPIAIRHTHRLSPHAI